MARSHRLPWIRRRQRTAEVLFGQRSSPPWLPDWRPDVEPLEPRCLPAVFTVTTAADPGPGMEQEGDLRFAVHQANLTPGHDVIRFQIPGTGPHTIALAADLPALTDDAGVTLDGFSQPGAQPNTLAVGSDAVLLIELDAQGLADHVLELLSSHNVVRGLSLTGARLDGVLLADGAGDNVLAGNLIGLDPTGAAAGNGGSGILLDGVLQGNTIGGPSPADRNVISANLGPGIRLQGGANNNFVLGNYLGTDPSGTADLGNGGAGVHLTGGAAANVLGGPDGAGNLISGNATGVLVDGGAGGGEIVGNYLGTNAAGTAAIANDLNGLAFFDAADGGTFVHDNLIAGNSAGGVVIADTNDVFLSRNRIGTQADGASPLANGGNGVYLRGASSNNLVGGEFPEDGNVIAHNQGAGVLVEGPGNLLAANRIFANGTLGIDLGAPLTGGDGITRNDAGDADGGGNDHQNVPVLLSAAGTVVTGVLSSQPNRPYRLEFYANPPGGVGPVQGYLYLGFLDVATDAAGTAHFSAVVNPIPAGYLVTATATDVTTLATSEFSAPPSLTVAPQTGSDQDAPVDGVYTEPLAVQVTDAYGNAAVDVDVTFTAPPGGPREPTAEFVPDAGNVTVPTDVHGVATSAPVQGGPVSGTFLVTATLDGVPGQPATEFVLTNRGTQVAGLLLSGFPTPARMNTGRSFVVSAVDAFGNLITDYTGTVTFTSDDPSAILPPPYTFTPADGGTHTFQATFPFPGVKRFTVTDGTFTAEQGGILITRSQVPSGLWFLAVEDQPWTGTVATFTSAVPGSDPLDYRATINWGDGTPVDDIALITSDDGKSFTVTGTHTYHDAATHLVSVTVRHIPTHSVMTTVVSGAAVVLTPTQVFAVDDGGFQRETTGPQLNIVLDSARARLTQPDASDPDATLFLALYRGNPQTALGGAVFYDLRVSDADPNATLVVRFRHPDFGDGTAELLYYDPASNTFRPVKGSTVVPQSLVDDPVQDLFTVTFDETSTPRLSELVGSVLTIGLKATDSNGMVGPVGPPKPPGGDSVVTVPTLGETIAVATPAPSTATTTTTQAPATPATGGAPASFGGFFVFSLSFSQDSELLASPSALRGESAANVAVARGGAGGPGGQAAAAAPGNSGSEELPEDNGQPKGDAPRQPGPAGQGGADDEGFAALFARVVGSLADQAKRLADQADDIVGRVATVLASEGVRLPEYRATVALANGVASILGDRGAGRQRDVAAVPPPSGAAADLLDAANFPLPPLPPWSEIVAATPPTFLAESGPDRDEEADPVDVLFSWPTAVATAAVLAGGGAWLARRKRWI